MKDNTDKTIEGYISAMLWSQGLDDRKVRKADVARIRGLVETFLSNSDVKDAFDNSNYSFNPAQFGHDLYLTRNGHGCGFWENDYCNQEQGELLTAVSKLLGTSHEDANGEYIDLSYGYDLDSIKKEVIRTGKPIKLEDWIFGPDENV